MKAPERTKMLLTAALCMAQLTTSLLLLTGCNDPSSETPADSTPRANEAPPDSPSGLQSTKIGGQLIASEAPNVAPIVAGTALPGITDERTFNTLFTTVTLCATLDAGNCQTIDHVAVDTSSSGLRIVSSVLSPWLLQNLVKEARAYDGNPIVECWRADDSYSWGSIRLADVQISGEAAENIPIQVIGDPEVAAKVPQNCAVSGSSKNTVQALGVNGILGVGVFAQDCGAVCAQSTAQSAKGARYYACPAQGSCLPGVVSLSEQVLNPVAGFRTDNNGVIVELPPVSVWGAPPLGGSLVFGIGTEGNNTLGSARVYTLDDDGYAVVLYKGASYTHSSVDSRSQAYTFNDTSVSQCSVGNGFYCPSSPLSLGLVIMGQNGASSLVDFVIHNEDSALNSAESSAAFSEFGQISSDPDAFVLGLPFFYGRNVFIGISGNSGSGDGYPYVAF